METVSQLIFQLFIESEMTFCRKNLLKFSEKGPAKDLFSLCKYRKALVCLHGAYQQKDTVFHGFQQVSEFLSRRLVLIKLRKNLRLHDKGHG